MLIFHNYYKSWPVFTEYSKFGNSVHHFNDAASRIDAMLSYRLAALQSKDIFNISGHVKLNRLT